eukprot:scaffold15090_cov50-Cyclotella_meneghiniana.AAC.5
MPHEYKQNCLEPIVTPEEVADENEHWFCPLCRAHGELIHFAQEQYLGDEEHDNLPSKEWENACDVFPEAESDISVAIKLKDGIRDSEVNGFLSGALGISSIALSTSNNESIEYLDDDDDESDDEDFDSVCEVKEDAKDADDSDDEDSLVEEERLLGEKIDKDELDALSVGSEEVDDDDTSQSDGSTRDRQSMRKTRRSARQARGNLTSDDEDDKPDVGTLDTANIVSGKRNRVKVDYRKLNDAMFGDESDDEAKGGDKKFAYKPKKVQTNSSDESDNEEESDNETDVPRAASMKTTQAQRKTSSKKRKRSTDQNEWRCDKCDSMVKPTKKRCGICQGWRGGVRENIRSPAKKKK